MKIYAQDCIRNVGLIGHGGAGKTSIAEALLFITGVADRLGKAGDNSSLMDYDPEEVRRGHSINASLAFCEWGKVKVNLLDTPGANNFITDTPACLRVVEGAVVVIGAESGVQYFTEKVWGWMRENSVRPIIFLNKIDHERADIEAVLDAIRKKLKVPPVLLQMPVPEKAGIGGLIDLASKVYYAYPAGDVTGKGKAGAIPPRLMDEVDARRFVLTEAIAECDEHLLEKYLEEGALSDEDMISGLRQAVDRGDLAPVFCGSAAQNKGIDLLLRGIVEYLPSPAQGKPWHVKAKNGEAGEEMPRREDGGFAGLVFKTTVDPYAGKLNLLRVYSGTLRADSTIYNANKGAAEKIGQLFALMGKRQIAVPEVAAGDFATVAKLKVTETGDTLLAPEAEKVFPPISFPLPSLSRAVAPKTRADEEKISAALHRLAEEDLALKVERCRDTHELLISGLGQAHLDVVIDKLRRRFGVEVDIKLPKVPYRETIRGTVKVQGRYKKQSGGRGQFGDTWLEIAPLPKGAGFQFVDSITGGAIPRQYIPAVEKGIVEAMAQGVLAHYPMVDIKVILYDGSYHNVDSSEMAFKIAASLGFKKGVADCHPILLEPVMRLEVVAPTECVGEVMGDLNSKRGKILGIDSRDDSQHIRAQAPMAAILNYASDLTSLTGGRGIFTVEFSHYDDVPEYISAKIVEEAKKAEKSS